LVETVPQGELLVEVTRRAGGDGTFGSGRGTTSTSNSALGALSLGLAQGALDTALAFTREREQFGKPLRDFQGIQFRLAEMATRIQAARHLVYHAAWLKQAGRPFTSEASMAKLFASDAAMDITTQGVQLLGGYGYTTDYPVERHMRDAKICQIGEGTNEIQKMVIARELFDSAFDGR
jgi:alkylation response protein AidB-like acyl-CoA dehydrogenase